MIRSIRMRPIEKPLVVKEIIYNHCEEALDTNSEVSFLRSSENTSKQQTKIKEQNWLKAVENSINRLQKKSLIKLNSVQKKLAQLENYSSPVKLSKNLIDIKDNYIAACRRLNHIADYNSQNHKFQMDENLNYVIDREYIQSEPLSQLAKLPQKQQTLSKSQSIKSEIRSQSLRLQNFYQSNKTTSREVLSRTTKCRKREKKSFSTEKQSKKGRVYQNILSLYSIPRLLAMEQKMR